MTEIIVFRSFDAARRAGADKPRAPGSTVMAWWPELGGDRLRGLELSRVTLASGVSHAAGNDPKLREALDDLTTRLRIEPKLWLDLGA